LPDEGNAIDANVILAITEKIIKKNYNRDSILKEIT
jgi:hypothetical protein